MTKYKYYKVQWCYEREDSEIVLYKHPISDKYSLFFYYKEAKFWTSSSYNLDDILEDSHHIIEEISEEEISKFMLIYELER